MILIFSFNSSLKYPNDFFGPKKKNTTKIQKVIKLDYLDKFKNHYRKEIHKNWEMPDAADSWAEKYNYTKNYSWNNSNPVFFCGRFDLFVIFEGTKFRYVSYALRIVIEKIYRREFLPNRDPKVGSDIGFHDQCWNFKLRSLLRDYEILKV